MWAKRSRATAAIRGRPAASTGGDAPASALVIRSALLGLPALVDRHPFARYGRRRRAIG
jgi:hypothetical protein